MKTLAHALKVPRLKQQNESILNSYSLRTKCKTITTLLLHTDASSEKLQLLNFSNMARFEQVIGEFTLFFIFRVKIRLSRQTRNEKKAEVKGIGDNAPGAQVTREKSSVKTLDHKSAIADSSEDDGGEIQMFAAAPKGHPSSAAQAALPACRPAENLQGSAGASKRGSQTKQPKQSEGGGEVSEDDEMTGRGGLMAGNQEERTFEAIGLENWLVKSCNGVGLTRPTDVQWHCIPAVLKGRDVMASAETGSGKTAAFALPILQLLARDPFGIFALVLTPTRELAFQIEEQFAALGSSIGLRRTVVVGGLDMMRQATELCKRPHVVIATPGRLADHIKSSHGVSAALKKCKFLVLDEADRLFEATFERDLVVILGALPQDRRTLLFSATMTQSI